MAAEKESRTIKDDFSHHLVNTGPIIESILKHLNARQLNTCATVCQSWSKIVKELKWRRHTRSWTCLRIPFENDEFETAAGLVEDTKLFLQNLYTEPDTVFMMCTTKMNTMRVQKSALTRSGRRTRKASRTYEGFVRDLLPRACKLIGAGASGIVGTSADCKERYELEAENDESGVSFLCLPRYEGVDISLCEDMNAEETDTKIQQFCDSLSQPPRQLCKVILMLVSDFQLPQHYGTDLIKVIPGALVAGAFVDGITTLDRTKCTIARLASIGGDNVHVASVLMDENVDNARDCEECVKKLKQCNLPEENSFAFMFACVGRGDGLYGVPDIESSLFKKHFPKTPLIGLFGNGEIGFEMVGRGQSSPEEQGSKRKQPKMDLYHSYTTVLVLVSIT